MTRTGIARLGTILGVWAHPDDEAFLSAGLMAQATDAGNRVVCVTATRGEAGTDDPGNWPPGRLGRLRAWELRASLAVLGVDEHRWLGYTDGTLDRVSLAEGIAAVQSVIEEVQPDTIVTFGPEGMTGHADHRAVSRWTTAARRLAEGSSRMLYPTVTPWTASRFAEENRRFDVFRPGLPVTTGADDLALHLRLDPATLDRKVAALRAQASQISRLYDAVGERRFREWWQEEAFSDADAGGGWLTVPAAEPVPALA